MPSRLPCVLTRRDPAALAFFLPLRPTKRALNSGPLDLLFPLPKMLFPYVFVSGLGSNVTSTKWRDTLLEKKQPTPSRSESQRPVSFFFSAHVTT